MLVGVNDTPRPDHTPLLAGAYDRRMWSIDRPAQASWMVTEGTRWLLRRSTDLVPQLGRLALANLRNGADLRGLPQRERAGDIGSMAWHDLMGGSPMSCDPSR